MKWLANLFKASPPPEPIEHLLFGTLIGSHSLNGQICSWETANPIDTPIGALALEFQAGAEGPTPRQVNLWLEIVDNLKQLREDAFPFLKGWLEELNPNLAPKDIEPSAILIWDYPETLPNWSLQFYLPSRYWRFTVTYENGKAAHTDFDRES